MVEPTVPQPERDPGGQDGGQDQCVSSPFPPKPSTVLAAHVLKKPHSAPIRNKLQGLDVPTYSMRQKEATST